MTKSKTIIVGGGASGLIAAGIASNNGAKVIILEKMKRCARKLRITGKGRCNLTNIADIPTHISHFGKNGRFLYKAYSRFFTSELLSLFKEIGIKTVTERGGRVFRLRNYATPSDFISMRKIFLVLFFIFAVILIPVFVNAAGLVPCGNPGECYCTICDFFEVLTRIYNFIIFYIASPLAVLSVTIGAVILMASAGNPNLAGLGKKVLWAAIIGLVLVFCSWLIINTLLSALGFNMGTWWDPSLSCPCPGIVPE